MQAERVKWYLEGVEQGIKEEQERKNERIDELDEALNELVGIMVTAALGDDEPEQEQGTYLEAISTMPQLFALPNGQFVAMDHIMYVAPHGEGGMTLHMTSGQPVYINNTQQSVVERFMDLWEVV